MVKASFSKEFKQAFKKIKNKQLKEKILKQIIKLKLNPYAGKPMANKRKGTREVYIKPHRLSYYLVKENIVILNFHHKDNQ